MGITAEGTARGAMRALDLPETEAPHLGVSSGGVEVEGTVFVRASLTGNGSPSSGRQLGRCGSGRLLLVLLFSSRAQLVPVLSWSLRHPACPQR